MEQKRKVKNLISCNRDGSILTILLLAIGMLLCLGSLGLMSVSVVGAGNESEDNIYNYSSGIDDKSEVLYSLELMDGNSEVKSKFSIDGVSLKIDSVSWIITGQNHVIGSDVYSNILGGDENTVYSNNITILGGEDVYIEKSNDDATILGGVSNTMNRGGGTPLVLIGGRNNKIKDNQDGVGIIGGSGNIIENGSENSFILGGEGNLVRGNNVIVGGKNVMIQGLNNVFVFSDSAFIPETSDSFYLNVGSGVGLNADANGEGLVVSGGIALLSISTQTECNANSLGLIGLMDLNLYGCLVGCTKASLAEGKWELLDAGEDCNEWCANRSDVCVNFDQSNTIEYPSYASYCLNNANTGHTAMCFPVLTGYENVAFESSLIDSDEECPDVSENKCIFKCQPGYHLTGDVAGGNKNNVRCYASCELPWDKNTKIWHNETVIGYKKNDVYCAYDGNSSSYPDTCAKFKKTLVCYDGTLYIAGANNKKTNDKAETNGYVYSGCMLHQYRCNTSIYDYEAKDLPTKFNDQISSWNLTDRGITNGVRGKYKLCVDYNTNPNPDKQLNGEQCDPLNKTTTNPVHYTLHYQWVGCQSNYSTGATHPDICKQKCKIKNRYGYDVPYVHGTTITGYVNNNVTCTDKCEAAAITCNDGTWIMGTDINGSTQNTKYLYDSCTLKDKVCSTNYNVTLAQWTAGNVHGVYDKCEPYNANGLFNCIKQDNKYDLTNCDEGYHTEDDKVCRANQQRDHCTPAYLQFPKIWTGEAAEHDGNFLNQWVGSWNSGGWRGPIEGQCEWDCDKGDASNPYDDYYKDGNVCRRNGKCNKEVAFKCLDGGNASNTGYYLDEPMRGAYWDCKGDGGIEDNNCVLCGNGYTYDDDKEMCVKNQNGKCINGGDPYKCGELDQYPNGKNPTTAFIENNTYIWNCPGNGLGTPAEGCHTCFQHYEYSGDKCEPEVSDLKLCGVEGINNNREYTIGNGSYTQIWSGNGIDGSGQWWPVISPVYDPNPETAKVCDWKCKNEGLDYEWNGSDCVKIEATCGAASGSYYENEPEEEWLCGGDGSYLTGSVEEGMDNWTWQCQRGNAVASCEAYMNQCSSENVPSGDGVITGSGVPLENNTAWQYKQSGTLGACEWNCIDEYEYSGNICIKTVYGSCGEDPIHYYCDDGDPINTGYEEGKWTWECQGTPESGDPVSCIECENGYYLEGDGCVKVLCNHCARSGFPYCFPIDFRNDCSETRWGDTSNLCDEGYEHGEGGACIKYTTFLSGPSFRENVIQLAGGTGNIEKFQRSGVEPSQSTAFVSLSTSNSVFPIYGWYENGTVYYYSEAEKLYLNANSSNMFGDFRNLTSVDTNGWDTSRVTDMTMMFILCSSLTILDVSDWNTSKVTSMFDMFAGCDNLITICAGDNFETSQVTQSVTMFVGDYKLKGGEGTTYSSDNTDKTYAHIDGGSSNPGYFTDCSNIVNNCVGGYSVTVNTKYKHIGVIDESSYLGEDTQEILCANPGDRLWYQTFTGEFTRDESDYMYRYIILHLGNSEKQIAPQLYRYFNGQPLLLTAITGYVNKIESDCDEYISEDCTVNVNFTDNLFIDNSEFIEPEVRFGDVPVDPINDGGGCFLSGTKVSTINGDKNIEEVMVGDVVLGYNEITKQNEYNKVVETFVHENNDNDLYEIITDGDVLKVTNVHPFYVVRQGMVNYERLEAQDLEVGDKLLMKDGNYKSIEMIYHYPYIGDVYNLKVENTHNYYVGKGYLVHNKDDFEQQEDDMVCFKIDPETGEYKYCHELEIP